MEQKNKTKIREIAHNQNGWSFSIRYTLCYKLKTTVKGSNLEVVRLGPIDVTGRKKYI